MTRRQIVAGLLGPLILLAVLPIPANAYPRPGVTERVSVSSEGIQTNSYSFTPAISADGRHVAFHSYATNLVPGDTNGARDVFVHDRETGTTERVSVASDGAQANSESDDPAISADGRYVAFRSYASNLVAGDTNVAHDVFVHDRVTGITERVSVTSDGAQVRAISFDPAISADGRHVAFQSNHLDINFTWDVFVHDRATGMTENVSVDSEGADGNASSTAPAISADGRHVAFTSEATNLVPGDTNDVADAFVHDRQTGITERVSAAPDGAEANGVSLEPVISGDGRHVAFASYASNLVPADTNATYDLFVFDRQTGTTERVSVASDGAEANAESYAYEPAISVDGRNVAFQSYASNLVPADTNATHDVFVHDRQIGTTERVSVTSDGAEAAGDSYEPAISADGRHVAFFTASTLIPGDTNGTDDVFVHDRGDALGIVGTPSVRKTSGGVDVSGRATFSGATLAEAVDPDDDGASAAGVGAEHMGAELAGAALVYRTEQEDLLVRLDLSSLPSDPEGAGLPGVVYGAGLQVGETRYEVRALRAGTTTTSPRAPYAALYRCDLVCTEHASLAGSLGTTGNEVLVSVPLSDLEASEGTDLTGLRAFTATGEAAMGALVPLDEVALSSSVIPAARVELGIADGATAADGVAFTEEADLAAGDFSGSIPTAELTPGSYRAWARACLGDVCGAASAASVTIGDGTSPSPSPSATPTESPTPTPTPTTTPTPKPTPTESPPEVSRPGITQRVSVASDGAQTNASSDDPVISAEGGHVAFRSDASNLVPGDTNGVRDVFVHSWTTGITERVSVASDGAQATASSDDPAISANGRHVAFSSPASNLVPADTNGFHDVFVRDRMTGTTERVSVASGGTNSNSFTPAISADGRYVAFESFASNLVSGDSNGTQDVFVHDRVTGTTERVSLASDGAEANLSSRNATISANGRYVVFESFASNLIAGDTNGAYDVFVHDRTTGATDRVSVASDGTEANSFSFDPAISADGGHIAFFSFASTLVPQDTNGTYDVFVHERTTGSTERVSVASDGTEANGSSDYPTIGSDGRYVAFTSTASGLVPGDTNGAQDVFVHDRATGATERVSAAADGTEDEANSNSFYPAISGDGRRIAFRSAASNLVPGDTNGIHDVFVHQWGGALGVAGMPSVQKVPGGVDVSGRATFSGTPVARGTDPDDDGAGVGPAGAANVGAEVTGAALIYRPELEDLFLRLDLSSLQSDSAGAGVLYGLDLRIGETRYEVRALRASATADSPGAPYAALYRCDPDCTEHAPLTGSFGTTGDQVLISVPLAALGAVEGTELTDLRAFTAAGEATPGALVGLDEVALSSSVIPAARVELGIADASTPADEVAFTVTADLSAGDFSGTVPTAGLSSGSYRVWAHACLGDGCGAAASAPVTLGDGPSPSPSPSATTTDTPTPTPTATESPVPEMTEVSFTERSAAAGQYSDEALLEAKLTDSGGDPIAEQDLTFELAGADSARTFTATTDADGVASVTPTLTEKPGTYQLTVRYSGDDAHDPSADTTTFVIDKEDTDLELTVEGKGKNRTLSARLFDRDTTSEAIAGRTIDFYADGESIGSATTNNNGIATLQAPPGYRGGKHDFEARFEGDDYYLGSADRART